MLFPRPKDAGVFEREWLKSWRLSWNCKVGKNKLNREVSRRRRDQTLTKLERSRMARNSIEP